MPTTNRFTATQPPGKLALVNDLTGYGRCSLTTAIPIVSQLGVQCCPVPTTIFSNHTGYPAWHMTDYTAELPAYLEAWKNLGVSFDGILTGFLGSQAQADIIRQFLADFKKGTTLYILDPAMGDNGRAYATCGVQIQESMRALAALADVVTPNVTEACLLTGTAYRPDFTRGDYLQMAGKLLDMGPRQVVITGIPCGSCVGNLCVTDIAALSARSSTETDACAPADNCRSEASGKAESTILSTLLRTKKVPQSRHGTGDIFAAILAAELVKTAAEGTSMLKKTSTITGEKSFLLQETPTGADKKASPQHEALTAAVRKASGFVRKCLLVSDAASVPEPEGVCFEKILYQLK